MFFRVFSDLNQSKSLQAFPDGRSVAIGNSLKFQKEETCERASRCIPLGRRGSITVEAALVFPLFLLGVTALLYLFLLVQIRVQLGRELTDAGKEAAQAAYFVEGASGTSILRLRDSREVQLPPGTSWFHPVRITQTRVVRCWTGFQERQALAGNDGEEQVYLTEYGTVYHRDLSCRHLKLSIQQKPLSETGELRNASGAKYYPCERCWKGAIQQIYITEYGNRYHESLNCPGLARGIRTVPLSQVGGLPPCSVCGG